MTIPRDATGLAAASTWRRFLVPGLSTLVMLIVLIGLGSWQVQRLRWKEAILARIAIAEVSPAVPLGPNPLPYTKISVTGRFRFDRVAQYGAEVRDTSAGPTMGFSQIVPLETNDAQTILVDRGWVPQKRGNALIDPTGGVTVIGYVRPGETPSWFSAADDPAGRQFFTLDPQAIAAALGVANSVSFTLVALGPPPVEAYPQPAEHLPRPPNNHLSYVITWYGLAVALVVIFVVWTRKASRS